MVKRPMLWLGAAFLLGVLLYRQSFSFLFALLCLPFFLYAAVFYWREKRFSWNRHDMILLLLPLLFFAGVEQMREDVRPCTAELNFQKKTSISAMGVVAHIQGVEGSAAIYLEDVILYGEGAEGKSPSAIDSPSAEGGRGNEAERICGRLLISVDSVNSVKIGNRVLVKGQVISFSPAKNPGQFNEYQYYKANDVCCRMIGADIEVVNHEVHYLKESLFLIKQKALLLYQKVLPKREAGIISAMVLGEQKAMDVQIKKLYQENGIAHILAISGLHFSILGLGFYQLLRKTRLSLWFSIFMGSLFILMYALLTGFGVSVSRAVIMMLISFGAKWIGCTYDLPSSLALAIILVLYKQPMMVTQPGFLLSFGAVFAIVLAEPMLYQLIEKKRIGRFRYLYESFIISLSVQIVTAPILLYFYFSIPLYGIILNLLILPLVSVLVCSALLSGMVSELLPYMGKFLAGGGYYILKLYEGLCRFFEDLPGQTLVLGRPAWDRILIYYAILVFVLLGWHKIKKRRVFIFLLLLCFPLKREAFDGLFAAVLEVGQGDCIFFRNENGTSFLVDGGSSSVSRVGVYRIKPFLLSLGIEKVDYVFVSHSDADHVNGIIELLGEEMIRNLILPDITDKNEAYREIEKLAAELKIPVFYFGMGDYLTEGNLKLFCRYPNKGMSGEDPNAASMVLELIYGEFTMLLTGDIDEVGEAEAAKNSLTERFTVLKAAHHGSNYSTGALFLQEILPHYTIISCGRFNSYGHPSKDMLERLAFINCEVYVTMDSGAVLLYTDGKYFRLREYGR